MFARFEQLLVSNGATPQKHIPYYIKWVTSCNASLISPTDKIQSVDQKNQFLDMLGNSRENWQVKQAEQALRLYTFFVSQYGQRPEPTSDEGKQWNQIIEKMIKVVRLKHLSLNTEKNYTGWNRQFQAFVNWKSSNVRFGETSYFANLPWKRRYLRLSPTYFYCPPGNHVPIILRPQIIPDGIYTSGEKIPLQGKYGSRFF
jgi:hypothetical protein